MQIKKISTSIQRRPLEHLRRLTLQPPGVYRLDGTVALISSPTAITQILNDEEGYFRKGPLPATMRMLVGDGTATSWFPPDACDVYGNFRGLEEWRAAKRSVVIRALGSLSSASCLAFSQQLAAEAELTWQNGQIIDIYATAHALFFRLSLQLLFDCTASPAMLEANSTIRRTDATVNRHLRSRIGEKIEYFDRLYAPRSEQWRAMPGKHFDHLRERRVAIDFLADELMNEKMALFNEILKLTTGTEELARYTVRADLIGLLFASHENSAASAAWLIWNLATNADWQEHVANEVSTNSQNGSGITSIKSNWSRLWNSLQETLRLHPPVWSLGRVVQSDIRLGDVQFNAGNTLIISPWLQHRHPAFWNHPDAFDSARFEQKPNPGKGAFLPFGGGIHGCPAEAFARLSICAVIAHWLRSWRFRAIRSRPSPQTVLGLTQQPDEGIWVHLESSRKQ